MVSIKSQQQKRDSSIGHKGLGRSRSHGEHCPTSTTPWTCQGVLVPSLTHRYGTTSGLTDTQVHFVSPGEGLRKHERLFGASPGVSVRQKSGNKGFWVVSTRDREPCCGTKTPYTTVLSHTFLVDRGPCTILEFEPCLVPSSFLVPHFLSEPSI